MSNRWSGRPREFRVARPPGAETDPAPPLPESQPETAEPVSVFTDAAAAKLPPRSESFYSVSWRRFRSDRTSMLALGVFVAICLLALLAPIISSLLGIDPNRQELLNRFQAPSLQHPLGTDEFGRDQLARLLHGAQVSLGVGFVVAGVSIVLGVLVGLWAGFYSGIADDLVNAIIQFQRGIPLLFVFITFAAVLGPPSPIMLAVLLGLWGWTGAARLVRGVTYSVKRRDYLEAARALGARDSRLIFVHVVPNILSIILVIAGFDIAAAILAEAGISFLGFGIQPPTPSWGNMLTNSLEYVRRAWWLVAAPGLAISVTVLCVLLIADGLRDAFDPRLR